MRYLLVISALVLSGLIVIQFVDEPAPGRPFEGLRIVLLTGGKPGESTQIAVSAGAERARRDLGCQVDVQCTNWDPDLLANLFQQEMAGVPDGICLMGGPESTPLAPLIGDAFQEGITVTSYARPLPDLQSDYSAQGFGFAGPDLKRAGYELISTAVEKHHLSPGSPVLVISDPDFADPEGLHGGALDAIQHHGLVPQFLEISLTDAARAGEHIRDHLREARDGQRLPALVCSLDAPLESTLSSMVAESIPASSVPLVGVGLDSYNLDTLRNSATNLSLVIEQNLPLQAYLTILQACLGRQYTAIGPRIETPFRIFDRDKLAEAEEPENTAFVQRF
ncbi:MAG: hypothetical protein JNK74_09865 [Candidatus Hydrogenedentes bacterium]|nr:hypothetical protein [Candidatus Hydrogenedentota bacterium]